MFKDFIKIMLAILIFMLSVYLLYFKTNMGFSYVCLPISGVPCCIASALFIVFVPFAFYCEFSEILDK